jgi:hypothetical protein
MSFDLGKLFIEWRRLVPTGIPNPYNDYHLVLLKEICLKRGIDEDVVNNVILTLEKKDIDPDTKITYKHKDPQGNETDRETTYAKALQRDKEHPAYIAAKKLQGDGGGEDTEDKSTSIAGSDISTDSYTDSALTDKSDDEEDGEEKEKGNSQSKREETISKVLELFIPSGEQKKGAGRFAMTQKDVDDYKAWLKLTPEEREAKQEEIVKRQKDKIGEVTEEDVDGFLTTLEERLGKDNFDSLIASIKKKGDPPGEYTKGKYPEDHDKYPGQFVGRVRARNVIKHYLQTGGVNPMNGEKVAFGDSQLDHIKSLDNWDDPNIGPDGPHNWMWMEARINQFKGSLTDTEVEAKLIERGLKTANELDKETSEADLKNWQTEAEIAYWETRFDSNDIANLSVESIEDMSAVERTNLVKAWNRYVGEGDKRYIPRYGTRKVEIDGKEYPISRDGAMQPVKDDLKTYGIQKQPDGSLKQTKMSYDEAMDAYNAARASGGTSITVGEVRVNIIKALIGVQSPFTDEKGNRIAIPSKKDESIVNEEFTKIENHKKDRKKYIDDLKKDIKANPQSADNLKKQIEKEPEYKKYKEDMKKAAGKGKAKKPDNPKEYARLKKEYDEWRLNKWRGWQSLIDLQK